VAYLGKVAKREVQGEAGGVDGAAPVDVGTGADKVVPVRVGEEAVAPAPGGGNPRVDGEGEPPRHVYRHSPPASFAKLRIGPSPRPARGRWSVAGGVLLDGNRVDFVASVYMRAEWVKPAPSFGRKSNGLTGVRSLGE
jgi:hypothetical protein